MPYPQDEGQKNREGLYLTLCCNAESATERDLSQMSSEVDGRAGEIRHRLHKGPYKGEDEKGGILARGADRQDCRGQEGRAWRRCCQTGTGPASQGPYSLGILDS